MARTLGIPTRVAVGYTPGLATAVWMGYTRGEIPMRNVHGISVSGGSFPAQIWRRFMEPALAGRPARAVKWEDGPKSLPKGAKVAVLEGDPNAPGPFVVRLKVRPPLM